MPSRPPSRARRLLSSAFVTGTITLIAAPATVAPKRGEIRSAESHPFAIRGGTLMIPLIARDLKDGWPLSLELVLENKQTITGLVAWVEPAQPSSERSWTQAAQPRAVRAVQPGDPVHDDTRLAPFGAYLLARLPIDGTGAITLGKQVMQPTWLDPAPPASLNQPPLDFSLGHDRPDPVSPFDYWRWVILAERMNRAAPDPSAYGEIGALVARHQADLWRYGLSRLERESRGVAVRCRELLTQTCRDSEVEFAAWVTDPIALVELLSILLDQRRDEAELARRALQWADARDPLLWWIDDEFGDQVRIAMANLSHERAVAKFTWPGAEETPIAAVLDPWVLNRVVVDRPPRPSPRGIGLPPPQEPATQWLRIEAGDRALRAAVGPRALDAVPPGLAIGPLRPPLTLAVAWEHRQRPVEPDRATTAIVRRLHKRWEVFFECHRAAAEGAQRAAAHDARGVEAVTLHVGAHPDSGGEQVTLTIPELGEFQLTTGNQDGSLEVHRRSFRDGWVCRIVLPDAWLGPGDEAITSIALVRTHGDSEAMESAPGPIAPWLAEPPRLDIRLGAWSLHPPAR